MARLQTVLDALSTTAEAAGPARLPEGLGTLEKQLADAVRGDMAGLYGGVLDVLGRINLHGTPDGYRKVTVCTWFGHVGFHCAYYGPDPARESRQARRRRERGQAAGVHRQGQDGTFPRKGGAPCAYPLQRALKMRDGMTAPFGEAAQRAGVLAGSFAEGSAMLHLFLGVVVSPATFRRRMLAAGRRALLAQEFPLPRLLTPRLPSWLLAATTATRPTLYIMLDGTGVPCVRKDTEGIQGRGEDGQAGTREVKAAIVGTYRRAKSILHRFGGAALARHLRKRYAALDAGHAAWGKLAYIGDRAEHMRYGEFRRQGLDIGSGPVEAACRTDVARRCKQAGMHWRFHNAAAICALTARFRSHLPAA